MRPFVGFALVTHEHPEQIAYLCHKLSISFGNPPIAIHHDYSKCFLDPSTLPSQVKIVKDWVTTAWGNATVIDAYLLALRLLYCQDCPEWTISLSAADYPIKSAARILSDLRAATVDGFLDFREVSKGCIQPSNATSLASAFHRPEYMKLAYQRYLSFSVIPRVLLRGRSNRGLYVSGDLLTRYFTPFSKSFRPYGGDWWHTINRKAAAVLIEGSRQARGLRSFLNLRPSPEESYYQTLLLNRPEIRIMNDNYRFTIWGGGGPHPESLGVKDVGAMVKSPAHFARKFSFSPMLYAAIDDAVRRAETEARLLPT